MVLFGQTETPHRLAVFLQENWRIAVPLLLGFAGVYLLLPQVGRRLSLVGGALAGAALVLAGVWWTRYEAFWVEQILFYIFAGLAVLGAGLMLSQKNPVHAALAFALVVLSSCGLFLLLAAPFLMAATIIIYAGAIVVTFLFVIMLAQQAGISSADVRSREPFLASLAGFIMLGTLMVVLDRGYSTARVDAVLERLDRVSKASSREEIDGVVGAPPKDQDPFKVKELEFVAVIREAFPRLKPKLGHQNPTADAVDQLEVVWNKNSWTEADLIAFKDSAALILTYGQTARATTGSVPAEEGSPAARSRKALPAQNVAALGRTLFTEYLIPVELAGVLLLVATIGAIVIASRRTEGLR